MKYFFVLLLLGSVPAAGQVRASLRIGYGSYSMQELKGFQSQLAKQVDDYRMRITDRFPSYLYYEGAVVVPLGEEFFYAANVAYGSTGGRVHYSDYSGELKFDQLLKYVSAGASIGVTTGNSNKYVFAFSLRPAIVLTRFDLDLLSRIGDRKEAESFGFRSTTITLQPECSLTRRFGRLRIEAAVGYNFDILKGKLLLRNDKEVYLLDASGNPVHAEWSGARLAVGMSYAFE